MYQKIGIQKLSQPQISKLLNGHRIRVKHGSGMEINCSQEQCKKIAKAHKKGCGSTIQFDPYQIQQHHQIMRGDGFFSDLAKTAVKTLAPVAIDALSGYAKNRVEGMGVYKSRFGKALAPAGSALFPAGYGVNPNIDSVGSGVKRKVGRPKGKGFFGDLAKGAVKTLAPVAIDALSNYAKSRVGNGVKPKRKAPKKRKGKGLGEDVLHGIEQFAPLALSFI